MPNLRAQSMTRTTVGLSLLAPPPSWADQAACTQVDPELFFPEQGDTAAAAKAICADCPVRAECLTFAIDHREDGIWGGLTERERRPLRKKEAS